MADAVRQELEQMIVTGVFANGERLNEARLAEKFSVSRTPLREAFQGLAASGLLELMPHRGAFVRIPGFAEMVEMFEVMAEFEAICGKLAARRIGAAGLAALNETVANCEAAAVAGDADGYYRENERFHHLIYTASGNGFLAAEAAKLHSRLQPFRRMQLRLRGRMDQSLAEHRDIMSTLMSGDSLAAATALYQHVAVQGARFHDLMASYRAMPQTASKR